MILSEQLPATICTYRYIYGVPTYDIGFERVSLSFATTTIATDITQGVFEGDRIGIVGRNGDGKSTLLRLLKGDIEPDEGRVTKRGGLRFGMLAQFDSFDDHATVRQAALEGREDYEWASDPQSRSIVEALLGGINLESRIGDLSGGQRRRADLARLLLKDWDILALDEPTNHLDVITIHWLAEHLEQRWPKGSGALLIVTHDRWFLDEVCTSMWEVHDATIEPFEGGYSAYMLQRVERDRQADVRESRRRNLARKELAWLTRGARARSTKQKFHVKAARALIADVPPVRNSVELKQMATSRLGKQVVDLVDVTEIVPVSQAADGSEGMVVEPLVQEPQIFGSVEVVRDAVDEIATQSAQTVTVSGRKLLDNVTWLIGPGDRFGIVGANGAGKTTLLRLIDGSLQPTQGHINIGKTVKFAVLSQRLDELEALGKYTIKEVLSRYKPTYIVDGKEVSTGQLMERLGFSAAQLMTPVKDLSGGQKRRMQLLLILLDEPNVLIMDEPGNDLDTDMLAVMEDLLDTWPGTLIVVSHDRYLLERVTDQQFALIGGTIRHLPGGVDDYLQMIDRLSRGESLDFVPTSTAMGASAGKAVAAQHQVSASSSQAVADADTTRSSSSASTSASTSTLSGKQYHDAMKRMNAIERKLSKLQDEKAKLEEQMAAHDQTDFEGLAKFTTQLQDVASETEDLEEQWMELSEAIGE